MSGFAASAPSPFGPAPAGRAGRHAGNRRWRRAPRLVRTVPGVLCGLLLSALLPAHAETGLYTIDPVHTRIAFYIDHAGFSRALGTFSGSTGTLVFDPDNWRSARLQVSVPLDRLDLGDSAWIDATLDLLDAGDHPQARFVSTHIEPVARNAARVCGMLTLHGTTSEVCLDVQLNQLQRYPLPPFRRTAGFSASGHLQRSDFGIDSWPSLIGDTVELRIEAEAIYQGEAPPAPPDSPTTPLPASPDESA